MKIWRIGVCERATWTAAWTAIHLL